MEIIYYIKKISISEVPAILEKLYFLYSWARGTVEYSYTQDYVL